MRPGRRGDLLLPDDREHRAAAGVRQVPERAHVGPGQAGPVSEQVVLAESPCEGVELGLSPRGRAVRKKKQVSTED